ncbi:M1 family metallopeptidase [Xanthomonas campestris pv. plantaginis]|nr:M1 family metallopeptidase [Xanthomonas campestris pv. plantaginis]
MTQSKPGQDVWQSAVRSYIKKYQYGNAVTDQLWQEVERVAPGKRFTRVAHDFTLQQGVPPIRVSTECTNGRTTLTLEQAEYTVDRPGKDPLRWHVPVAVRAPDGTQTRVVVDGTTHLSLAGCGRMPLVNAGQKGYFRTLYTPAMFKALTQDFSKLPVVDQLGMMIDTNALSAIGLQPVADSLDLTKKLAVGGPPDLWASVAETVEIINEMYRGHPQAQTLWRP